MSKCTRVVVVLRITSLTWRSICQSCIESDTKQLNFVAEWRHRSSYIDTACRAVENFSRWARPRPSDLSRGPWLDCRAMLLRSWTDCVAHSSLSRIRHRHSCDCLECQAGIRPDRHVQLSVVGILTVFQIMGYDDIANRRNIHGEEQWTEHAACSTPDEQLSLLTPTYCESVAGLLGMTCEVLAVCTCKNISQNPSCSWKCVKNSKILKMFENKRENCNIARLSRNFTAN